MRAWRDSGLRRAAYAEAHGLEPAPSITGSPACGRCSADAQPPLQNASKSTVLGLGGEAGARLASRLAMPVSADTLLRLIRAEPVSVTTAPRVIGIDDWAWRRGRANSPLRKPSVSRGGLARC